MSYISIPRDLSKVKSKILFNLTKRQLLCFGAAALIGVPSFFLFKSFVSISAATLGMMLLMLPLFFLGMYEKDGMPCEVLIRHFIQAKFIRPKNRPYQTNNDYQHLLLQATAETEIRRIVQRKPAEKGEVNI